MAYPLKQSTFEIESRTILSNFGYTVLAPIVRILMRFGYSARDFNDLARWVYVHVFYTTPDFWRFGRPTALQGAIKTGIPRSIVKQIREIPEPQQILFTQRQNIAYRVIEGWVNDPEYHVDGKASVLPLHSRLEPSFRKLAHKYSNDVTLGAVLGDLSEVGCIRVENGLVTLVNQTYGLSYLNEDALALSAYMLQKHGETVDHNLTHPDIGDRKLHRIWWQSQVPLEKVPEVERLIREAGARYGREIDQLIASYAAAERREGVEYAEVGFTGFCYSSSSTTFDAWNDELKKQTGDMS